MNAGSERDALPSAPVVGLVVPASGESPGAVPRPLPGSLRLRDATTGTQDQLGLADGARGEVERSDERSVGASGGDGDVDVTNGATAARRVKRKGTSPTKRALAECRKRGWTAQVVERWNQWAKKSIDLFGVIDIVAITPAGILGIQVTSGAHHAERCAKAVAEPRVLEWVNAGGRFEVWSFTKRGQQGKRKLWTLRSETYAEMVG